MTIFNVLKQKCNIFGKRILEASAGTGKTFAIEHIVLRLLLEKESLTIDRILVVTFTKIATKELKFRIRNNLEKAIRFLKQKEVYKSEIFNYLTDFINNDKAIFKLQNAVDLFETAQIFTIHSFCFKNLKEFALDADVLIENEEEKENDQLIKKLIYDYLKFYIKSDEYSSEQIEILINKHRNIENLCEKIFHRLDKNVKNKRFKNFNKLFKEFSKEISDFEKVDISFVINIFNEIKNDFIKRPKFKNIDFIKQLELLIFIINKGFCTKEDFKNVLKTKGAIFEFFNEKNRKISSKRAFLPVFLQKIEKKLYPIIKEAVDFRVLFYRLLNDISFQIDQYLEKEEILTFDKILYKMKLSINSKSLKKKIQNKYKAVIIDEFQDTDPVQFEIFDNLFFSNKNILAVYLIGDPKQSIYSFRKADLYTYLNASKKIKEINYLDTNYRSSKSLINSLNALFSENFAKKWLKLPQISKNLAYLPIKSGLNTDFIFNDKFAPLHFFIAQDNNKSKKWPTEEIEQKYFSFITNEIWKLKNKHQFLDSNFAVLVKDRYQAQRLKNYFDKFFIKSVTIKKTSLKYSIVIKALKQFFEAVIFPYDLNKVKIALKGAFIQLSDEEIKNFDLEKNGIYIEKFYFLRSVLLKGISYFFNSFFYSKWPDKTILENIGSKRDINFYHETMNLIEILISQKNLTFNQILNFFKKLENLDPDDENLKMENSSDLGVQILTTFMSKGLEYDIVFALGLANRTSEMESENLEEIDAEKMRQFYVALTRAKYRAYIPIAIDTKEKEIKEGSYSCVEYFLTHILETKNIINKQKLLNKLESLKQKNHISYDFIDSVKKQDFNNNKQKVILKNPENFNRNFTSRYTYSFSSLQKGDDIFWDEKKQKTDLPVGPEIGILFHNIFEKIINNKSYEDNAIRKIIQENILDSEFAEHENEMFIIIKKTIQAPLLNDKSFCLKEIPSENVKPEIEFLFSFKKDYIKGFIDLVFFHDNKYYIVDWKSNYLGPSFEDYKIENLEKQMIRHNYFLQAAIYTKSLERHLKILKKDFNKVFGGVFYIFLRGFLFGKRCGIYHFFPDLDLINKIDKKELLYVN